MLRICVIIMALIWKPCSITIVVTTSIITVCCQLPFKVATVCKVKEPRNRPSVAQRVPGGLGSQIPWHSAREGSEVVSLTHRPPLPPEMFLVLIFTRGWVDRRAVERSEGDMSLKNPVTPPGIDPGTVRLVAQHLNHYVIPGPGRVCTNAFFSQALYDCPNKWW
jgi:hypothetical protein